MSGKNALFSNALVGKLHPDPHTYMTFFPANIPAGIARTLGAFTIPSFDHFGVFDSCVAWS